MKKYSSMLLFLSLVLFFAVIIPSTTQAAEPKRGGWLTVATDSTAVGLDPQITIAFSSATYFEHCYESLLGYNTNMELVPCLATSWEQPDPLTYVFHLRKGVKFHDGSDFTAKDVKFTFERMLDPKISSPRKPFFESINKIEMLDPYKIKFSMSEPYPPFLNVAATWYGSILSKAAVEKHGSMQSVAIGTGPFKLKTYEHGVKGVFERFSDYWDKPKPYIDGFDFIVITDETSRIGALRKGTVDIGWVVAAQMAKLIEKEKDLKVLSSSAVRQQRLWFKVDKPPLDNIKVRQAISACIDRKEIIDTVMFGNAELSACIPTDCKPYGLSQKEMANLPFYKQDYGLAKKLLAEAGYPNGFKFTLITSSHSPDYIPCAEILQRQLLKAGIQMKIEQKDWGITLKTYRTGEFDAIMFAGVWYPDPEAYCAAQFHSKSSGNHFGYNDPKLDKLFDTQKTEVNLEKRVKIWREIQRHMAETAPCIYPYTSTARYEIVNKKVQNYYLLGNNSRIMLREAWLEK